jgi:hypothetical protein
LSIVPSRGGKHSLQAAVKRSGIHVAPDEHHASVNGRAGIRFKARSASTKLEHEPADWPIKPDDAFGSKDIRRKPFVQPCLKLRGLS